MAPRQEWTEEKHQALAKEHDTQQMRRKVWSPQRKQVAIETRDDDLSYATEAGGREGAAKKWERCGNQC